MSQNTYGVEPSDHFQQLLEDLLNSFPTESYSRIIPVQSIQSPEFSRIPIISKTEVLIKINSDQCKYLLVFFCIQSQFSLIQI